MSKSWGHTLRAMTSAEIAHHAEQGYFCGAGKCRKAPAWWGVYSYVTGRAGRVTTAFRPMCDQHATDWKRKNEAADGLPGRVPTAAERAFHQIAGPS